MLFISIISFLTINVSKCLELPLPVRLYAKYITQPPSFDTTSVATLPTIPSSSNVLEQTHSFGNPPPNIDPPPPHSLIQPKTNHSTIYFSFTTKNYSIWFPYSSIYNSCHRPTLCLFPKFPSSTTDSSFFFITPLLIKDNLILLYHHFLPTLSSSTDHPQPSLLTYPSIFRPSTFNSTTTSYNYNASLHPGFHNFPQPSSSPPFPNPLPPFLSTHPRNPTPSQHPPSVFQMTPSVPLVALSDPLNFLMGWIKHNLLKVFHSPLCTRNTSTST